MNFYNEDEDKKGAPVIPGTASPFKKTSAFGKTPMFSRATGSIIDRLKNLSRKDMAFVGIGLSVLVMAPVAEYMMSQPAQDNLLKETFNPRSGPGGVMDPGINGLSTGSPDGSGEVITPLSSRDPMSLILGAQPAAAVMPPPSAPPTTSYRDAMKESGRAAFTEASKSAGAPTVIPKMQAAMSRLFADGGGSRTSGTLGGGKIIEDARSASSKAKSRSMVGPVAMAGYKGVASTPNSSSKGAFEKLRAQADRSAGNFSGGSAMNSLDKAAADAVNVSGSGGLGAGGDSEKIKGGSGSTTKYDHNRSGESLAEAAAKARQAKALEWEFFKKYEFKKQLLTAVFGAISTEVGKFVGGAVGGALNPPGKSPDPLYCWGPKGETDASKCTTTLYPMSLCNKDKGISCNPGDCCKIAPKGAATDPANPGANPPTGPGTSQGNVAPAITWPIPVATDFDGELKTLRLNIEKAEDENDDAKKFTELAVNVAGGLYQISGQGTKGNEFPFVVGNTIAKIGEFNQAQQAYKMKTTQARMALDEVKKQNTDLLAALGTAKTKQGAIAKAKGEKLTKDSGATAEIVNEGSNKEVGTQLDAYVNGVKVMQETEKTIETELAFLEKGAAFFTKQTESVSGGAAELRAESIAISGKAKAAMDKMAGYKAAVQSGPITPELLKNISASFMEVTGIPLEISESSSSVAAARDGEVSLVDQLLVLRGADKDSYWKKVEVVDTKFKDQEPKDWAQLSPKAKMGNLADQLESPALAKEIRVVPVLNIRAENELPSDLKALSAKLNELFSDGNGRIEQLKGISDAHKKKVDDFIGVPAPGTTPGGEVTPGGNTPGGNTPPVVVADPALTARSNNLQASAALRSEEYAGAKKMVDAGLVGNNKHLAQSAYNKMGISREHINRITTALSAPGAKPTKEQLDELEGHLANFNTSYNEFAKYARNSNGATVKPQPAVVNNININTSANANANATSGSSALVRPTTNNNTTNNTTINNNKPPVVVQPVIQPAKPPAVPSEQLRLRMPDNGSMVVDRFRYLPATGEAAYKASYRESGSYLGILAKTAYNYQVTCLAPKGGTYTIRKVEAAPVAFPAGEKTGWLMELLIKKFLRISDIQFGRMYDVSSQRSDLIGKTCHQ